MKIDDHDDINMLVALTTQPVKWLTVARRGESLAAVLRYVNDWPTYPVGDEGLFVVCTPSSSAEFFANRLASGLFYAKVHDTHAQAKADAVDNYELVAAR